MVEKRTVDGLGEERSVRVVRYDPSWPASFETVRGDLAAVVPGALTTEHVGVRGLPTHASLGVLGSRARRQLGLDYLGVVILAIRASRTFSHCRA